MIFYNRGHFNGVDYDDMIDVTEVWEYNDRKEVNTSRQYEIAGNGEYLQFVAITELLSGKQKTVKIHTTGVNYLNNSECEPILYKIAPGILHLEDKQAINPAVYDILCRYYNCRLKHDLCVFQEELQE